MYESLVYWAKKSGSGGIRTHDSYRDWCALDAKHQRLRPLGHTALSPEDR